MDKVYIQTFSIRDVLEKDFVGSIEKLAKIGYAGVEFAGQYGGLNAKDMKKLLDDNGLDCISAHIGFQQTEEYIDYMAEVGARYIICPSARVNDYETAMAAVDELNRLGTVCKKAGLKYGYHNHTGEFRTHGDKYLEDILIENTDPETVVFQLDVGWCTTAGVNAVDYINRHAGRFEMVHAKEAGKVVGTEEPVDFSKVKFGPDKRPIFTPEMILHGSDHLGGEVRPRQKTHIHPRDDRCHGGAPENERAHRKGHHRLGPRKENRRRPGRQGICC